MVTQLHLIYYPSAWYINYLVFFSNFSHLTLPILCHVTPFKDPNQIPHDMNNLTQIETDEQTGK